MAPSCIDCAPNDLFCAEDALGVVAWDDGETGSLYGDEDQHYNLDFCDQQFVSSIDEHLWDDTEVAAFVEKETLYVPNPVEKNSAEAKARQDAVDWILKVHAHYGFGPVTAVLSMNYLDRFLSANQLQQDKPWMTQLAAVACLSLAAKMDETEVPLLLDFQVEEAKYIFESRTIQRMELLVLSTLEWRMSPVTPLSYIDHASRMIGLENRSCWIFTMRCKEILLNTLRDAKFLGFLPSVVAAAIMLHVIKEIELVNPHQYGNRLLSAMKVNKDMCERCIGLLIASESSSLCSFSLGLKRKSSSLSIPIPGSPDGVLDATFSCSSSSCGSGQSTPGSYDYNNSSILCISPAVIKKRKLNEFCSDLHCLED